MDHDRAHRLLSLLDRSDYRTAAAIAQGMGLGERTVRASLHDLDSELSSFGAQVESRPRFGFRLQVNDEESFARFGSEYGLGGNLPATAAERADYLAVNLLFQRGYVKRDDLCAQLYVSHSTLSAAIKGAEATLARYGLRIDRKPNHGIRVRGSERDMRRLLVDYLSNLTALTRGGGIDISHDLAATSERVRELFVRYGLPLPLEAYASFANVACISLWRALCGFDVGVPSADPPPFMPEERAVVRALLEPFAGALDVDVRLNEEVWLLTHLAANRSLPDAADDRRPRAEGWVELLATRVLSTVATDFRVDLSHDELRALLARHLAALDVRMRFGMPTDNPLTDEIKLRYPLSFAMAMEAGVVLEGHYGASVGEGELGYLALIFQLAMERNVSPTRRNALLVSGERASAARLFAHRVRARFGDVVEVVGQCSPFELGTVDWAGVDCVITNAPLGMDLGVPVVGVSHLFTERDEARVRRMLSQGNPEREVSRFIGRERFLLWSGLRTKDEVLARLCAHISAHENVDRGFYALVADRTREMPVRVGTGVALPYPSVGAADQGFAYVLVLEEPVPWDGDEVSVVILCNAGREKYVGPDVLGLVGMVTRFGLNRDAVESLVREPTYDHLVKLLV